MTHITVDNLRAAGWEIKEVGDNGPCTPKENRDRFEKWLHADEFNACCPKKVLFFDRSTGRYSLNGQRVGFMEQLTDNL